MSFRCASYLFFYTTVFTEYVQDEIDDLYDDVPEVKNLFKIVDKIGEGIWLIRIVMLLLLTKLV